MLFYKIDILYCNKQRFSNCLDYLPSSLENVIVKINDNITLIRSNLNNFSDVVKWIEEFSVSNHNVLLSVPN